MARDPRRPTIWVSTAMRALCSLEAGPELPSCVAACQICTAAAPTEASLIQQVRGQMGLPRCHDTHVPWCLNPGCTFRQSAASYTDKFMRVLLCSKGLRSKEGRAHDCHLCITSRKYSIGTAGLFWCFLHLQRRQQRCLQPSVCCGIWVCTHSTARAAHTCRRHAASQWYRAQQRVASQPKDPVR